jgi:hypothetical protein
LLFGSSGFGASTKVNTFDLWARVVSDLEFFFERLKCVPRLENCFGVFVGPFCNTSLNKICRFTNTLHLSKGPFLCFDHLPTLSPLIPWLGFKGLEGLRVLECCLWVNII